MKRQRASTMLGMRESVPRLTDNHCYRPGTSWYRPQDQSNCWGGFAGTEHTVAEWVTTVFDEQPDVAAKLAAHRDVAERHAFSWATLASDKGCRCSLSRAMITHSPMTPPTLPAGVTHVWLAGSYWSQGVLAWFAGRFGSGRHGAGHQRARRLSRLHD
jgi:hypothetical protein